MPEQQELSNETEQVHEENSEKTEQAQTENSELSEEQAKEVLASLVGEEKPSEDSQKEQTEETQSEPTVVIDDKLISQFPTLRSLKGKSVTDLAQSYDNVARKLTTINQEVKKLKTQEAKKTVESLGKPPDSVDHPEEFEKWMKDRDEIIRQQAISQHSEETTRQQQYIDEINNALKAGLPKDVNPQEVILNWMNDNAYKWYDESGQVNMRTQNYYAENPNVFVQEVIAHAKIVAQQQIAQKDDKTRAKEAKLTAHQLAQKTYQDARKNKLTPQTQVNLIQRQEEETETDKLIREIYENLPQDASL